ncbi:MAG TPA: sugar phosphate nucleotidyltransferase, partial [Patescibacteria group bacterium]|nr:sugar phosphate nucleotidyltransferase [Patescibacteria group bacterium]
MQAVLLAAGRSSRFVPFTDVSHKSMIGLCGKPILAHTISSLKKVGITDIVIVVNEESDIPEIIGKGKEFGVTISYVTHVGAKGMGAALLDAKEK